MNTIVSPDCMSTVHNTLNAAYSKRGRPRCTCPYALELLESERERQRARTKERREADGRAEEIKRGQARVPQWQRVAGHWPIDPACPARGHNTVSWARGGHSGREARCICPHAQEAYTEYLKVRRVADRERKQRSSPLQSKPLSRMDWSRGVCHLPENIRIADGGFDERVTWSGVEARAQAKALCKDCPILAECAIWITEAEEVPGEMGGVYGGMDVWDRRGRPIVLVNGRWRSHAAA